MRLPILVSEIHKGKILELDCDQEMMTLLSADGEPLGNTSWDSVIDFIRSSGEQERTRHARAYPQLLWR